MKNSIASAIIVSILLAQACTRTSAPTSDPVLSQPPPVEPAVAAEPVEPEPAPRTSDPDPLAVQQGLDAILGFPVTMLDRQPMTNGGPSFRDFVVFKAEGETVCKANRSLRAQVDCNRDAHKFEIFGVAIVSFEDPMKPRITLYRFIDYVTSNEAPASALNQSPFPLGGIVELDSLAVEDVDGDGEKENVFVVSYEEIGFEVAHARIAYTKELFVVRDDLTIEFNCDIHEWLDTGAEGVSGESTANGRFTFTPSTASGPGTLTIEYCEFDSSLEACWDEIESYCEQPTTRVTMVYDHAKDAYPSGSTESLRPIPRDWEDVGCGSE